jgi:SAM-dependent methyltransferase
LVGANEFDDPRIAAVYDIFEADRRDLDVYANMVEEFGAARVLDLGCGTGTLAIMLAARGFDVTGVDPAGAMLDVARAKPGADRVRWIHGDASSLPALLRVDLVTMTGNAAQAIVDDDEWQGTLRGVHDALAPGGRFVFETREPSARAWETWTRKQSYVVVAGMESWEEVTKVEWPVVTFDSTTVLTDGSRLVTRSTLRFREQTEVEAGLLAAGFVVDDVRDALDRPGRELVFVARVRRSLTQARSW